MGAGKKKREEVIVSVDDKETRAVVLEDREVVEIYLERAEAPSIVGNIYKGVVRNVLPGMEAAFVDIGTGKNAFLYVKETVLPHEELDSPPKIQHILKEGQEILVQIIKDPMGTKGARATAQITLACRYLVLLPFSDFLGVSRRLEFGERERLHQICNSIRPRKMGLIARTAAEGADRQSLQRDLKYLRSLWKNISAKANRVKGPTLVRRESELALRIVRDIFSAKFDRLVIDSNSVYKRVISFLEKVAPELRKKVKLYQEKLPLFDKYQINEEIKKGLERRVWLRSGGHLTIDQTEALTAIDVNTGKYIGRKSLEDTILRTNLEAAKEAVRQLRLRDIGGIIVIDFIDMENHRHREKVFLSLNEALFEDRTKTRVVATSQLGLVEMTRKNVSEGLVEYLSDTCPRCQGTGRVVSKETTVIELERNIRRLCDESSKEALLFRLNPDIVVALLENRKRELRRIQRATGKRIFVYGDPTLETGSLELVKEGERREIERLAKREVARVGK